MQISRSVVVKAGAQAVYDRVSDLTRMGELSDENVGGRWLGGATGPAPGARFHGTNRNGWRRWSTSVRVLTAEPGREFSFLVRYVVVPVSMWTYRIAEHDGQCTVTETWTDRRPAWFKVPAGIVTGVMDRDAATALNLEHTLARLKATLEQ